MPTYGYRCQSCEREFDVWQRMTDEAKAACPTCGGSGKRQFFPAGLVFKGSGFYVTDNRRSASSNGSAASGAGSGGSGAGDSGAGGSGAKTPKPAAGASDGGSSSSGSTAGSSAGNASGNSSD